MQSGVTSVGRPAAGVPRESAEESLRPAIQANSLGKRYVSRRGTSVEALTDVSLSVGTHEFVAIVGPSGCGKSTLLKMVAGLLAPTTGALLINGRPVSGPSPEIGVVFQSPILLPWKTVIDNVLLPVRLQRRLRPPDRDEAHGLIRLVGLEGFEHRYPFELSGGMSQRVAICRALMRSPSILAMDEPFGALDALTREYLNIELLNIWSASNATVLFITHSIPEAVLLADRVVVMTARPGRVAKIVEVDLARPRTLDTMATSEFAEYTGRIRQTLGAYVAID